uniref:Junctional cadherin 5 associated a n=1 Tax=Hucho hucho TaxID=62062 RepID=A0A4W5LDN9_9TELE
MTAVDRKCQSLGTDECRPAVVSFSCQLSDSKGERWSQAQEQYLQQRHLRTPDGAMVVMGPRNKGKSQSLPRMMQPDSLQYVEMSGSIGSGPGQDVYRRVNGHPGSHYDPYSRYNHNQAGVGDRDRWPENDNRPSSQASMASQVSQVSQASQVPKVRYSRPPRPPSYEVHQQTRGSSETLSGDPEAASTLQPQARDRTPLPHPSIGDPRLDYYTQDGGSGTEPPGYIPPPSYPPKRAPQPMRGSHGGHRGYGEVPVNYRYHQMYKQQQKQQMRGTPDPWFGSRHTGGGGSWPEPHRERSVPHRKQHYTGYSKQQHQPVLGPGIQYIPFDDPRLRHVSGGGNSSLCGGGNSMTDADKIRHIRNSTSSELPSVTVSDHSSDDSAFLSSASTGAPPPLASTPDPASPMPLRSSSDYDNNNNRWQQQQQHCDLHKETGSLDNFPAATSENCNRYNPKPNQGGPSVFQPPAPAPPVCHSSSSDQGFSETTITQVKKIVPGDSGVDNLNRNSKRKAHSETIFCLVSVPLHMQQTNKDSVSAADQNNNENMPASLPSILPIVSVIATEDNQNTVVQSKSENSQSLCSKSLSDMGLKPPSHTSSFTSMRSTRKGPLRKERVDAWSLQASADKELCYAGSWPGDQYRNQETQTSSPVAVKGPWGTGGTGQPQSPPGGQGQGGQGGQETGHPASDTTMDSGAGTDCSSGSYGVDFPMKGQKNLHPSSNSAFSCLSISPAQPMSLPPQPPPPVPGEGRHQQTSTSRKTGTTTSNTIKPPVNANANSQGQVAFGQFLLKPVSRRPWDAIEELESFNKAAGVNLDQVQKKMKVQTRRPSVDQCIDDLDEVYRNIMELSGEDTQQQQHQHIAPPHLDPEMKTVSLPDQRLNNKPNNNIPTIMPRLDSWSPGSTIDPDYREVRSAFSRPHPQSRTSILRLKREDLVPTATLTESTGFRDYNSHNAKGDPRVTYDSRLTYRQEQDIPVAKESLLRDVGLTVYTEAPGGTVEQGQHCGHPFTQITPLDHNVQLSTENRDIDFFAKNNQVEVVHISDGNNKEDLGSTKVVEGGRKVKKDNVPIVPPRFRGHEPNLNIRRARSENSRSPRGEGSQGTPHTGSLTREAAFAFEDDDYRYSVSSDPLSWRNEATLADIHLETLLIKEKANTMPTEDLSNLYEVKCAKGIPENETMEQRAARILGIDVAPDSLRGMVQEREEEKREEVSLQGVVEVREEDRQEYREDEGETVIGETQEHRDNTETERETQELSPEGAHAVESLGMVEQKEEEHRDNPENEDETLIGETLKHSPDEDRDTKHVRREYEQVMKVQVSVVTLEEETTEEEEETRGGPSKDGSLSVCEDTHNGGDRERSSHPSMVLDLPEFPPSSLPLSLPVTPDDELALSLLSVGAGGERKGHIGGASLRLSSSTSPGCTESMVHLGEVFSVSCVLIRSLDSGEPEPEVVVVVQVEAEQEIDEGMSQAEKKGEREEMEEEELRIESEPEGKEIDRADKREDERIVSGEEKELEEELKIGEKEQELTIKVEKELKVRMEEEKRGSQEEEEREVQEGKKEPEEDKTERQVEEEEKEPEVKREEERSEKSDEEQQQEVWPEPVSRPMEPPLLPKPVPMPRSGTVAKREITLPLSFSVSSCGCSTTLEEDELLSEFYDPSRVERV